MVICVDLCQQKQNSGHLLTNRIISVIKMIFEHNLEGRV